MYTEGKELADLVLGVIERHRDEVRVSPSWVANEVMEHLDPERVSVELVYAGCHLELRQIARGLLRGKFDPPGAPIEEEQHDLFPELQKRYPVPRKRGEEPVYVLLEHLTPPEAAFNVSRLRGEAGAKLRHADALEAYMLERFGSSTGTA